MNEHNRYTMKMNKEHTTQVVINLRVLDETITLRIKQEDEGKIRMAAQQLNARAKEIREKYLGVRGQTLLAFIALEKFLKTPECFDCTIDKNISNEILES